MTDPSTFQPLVTDFAHEANDEREDGVEQVRFLLDNGYTVSAIRGATEDGRFTAGYEDGNWELMLGVRNEDEDELVKAIFPHGVPLYEHELYDEGEYTITADNARVNEVVATVQALPRHERVEVNPLELLLAGGLR